jgi:hypothetical protein
MPSSTSSSERARSARRRRRGAGLLVGLLLFAAGERALWSSERVLSFVARYTPAGPDGDPLLAAAALRTLPSGGPPPVLLLGSSQVREGLDCEAFELRLPGRPCRNLAIGAGSPLDMLTVARRARARAPRRVLVLGLFPKILHVAPKAGFVGGSTLRCVFAGGNWRGLGATQWVELAGGALEALSPTLRFKDALGAFFGVVRADPRAAWRLELPPQPKRLMAHKEPQPPRYFARFMGRLDGDAARPGEFTGAQEAALERLIDDARARGDVALVVDFPTRPGYETTQPPETLAHYRDLVERLRRRPDMVFVEAGELGPLELADFQDFTHLSEAGRAKVSRRVAERVASVLSAR